MSSTELPPFSTATGSDIRVRFCPSPTGTPHVGLIRTALFNWAYARHNGGKMVFRIEDTDAARDSEESYGQLLDALRWLRIDWDEGIDVGGPHGPYRQSERTSIYLDLIEKLKASGHLYESYSTAEEIDARNEAAGRPKQLGYDNFDRSLTDDQRQSFRDEGRLPALRLRVPDSDLSFDDLVRGEITFPAGSFVDFVVVRPNGAPLYTFVNPVDDALMGVTHVLRGEDLLSSTPRQIALYSALVEIGVTTFIPRFGHLPYVMGEGNKKLSKRDPEANLFHHRDRGFIPEGLVNYLALLGWSLTHDRDVFSIDEMVAAFDVVNVNPNPARFDLKKAESINGDHIRLLAVDDFARRTLPYLETAGILTLPATDDQLATLAEAAPLVQERMALLGEAPAMLGFLFQTADEVDYQADALATLPENTGVILAAAVGALELIELSEFTHERIKDDLAAALIEGLGLKPRVAYGPLRVALSGRKISPPLFESMQILGRAETVARLARLAALHAGAGTAGSDAAAGSPSAPDAAGPTS
ncbi:glutamate--tRNA ligase [Subtercola boreus]|uniref:Glutamate--tRNA ligase n=1 Tax=Subtercola boreus TaxID=120213 RepID=A0A3E0VFJ6_9MICO|nr:glutamate--tRNA ligase [Subtercola boreus]RFA08501.1 glutamate--tRNA ligase [Subtercola boreus]TQL54576.1 glutamyl-tRNA synthetase [Subtercola boreus]